MAKSRVQRILAEAKQHERVDACLRSAVATIMACYQELGAEDAPANVLNRCTSAINKLEAAIMAEEPEAAKPAE